MISSRAAREGIVAGMLGASAVVVWFFVADQLAGTPFRTPLLLASAVFAAFGAETGGATALPIAIYTVIHYAAFIGVGVATASILNAAQRTPSVMAGVFLMFAVFETGFYTLCVLLSMLDMVGTLAWYQMGAANILASVVMGVYLWKRHPEVATELDAALAGKTT